MAKRKSIPINRYPWARHHYREGQNGYDRGCHACAGDAEWTVDWEYTDTGERWRGAVCPRHDPGPLPAKQPAT